MIFHYTMETCSATHLFNTDLVDSFLCPDNYIGCINYIFS